MKSRLHLLVVLLFIGTAGIIFLLSGRNTETTDDVAGLEIVEDANEKVANKSDVKSQITENAVLQQAGNKPEKQPEDMNSEKLPEEQEKVFVHVCGAVNKEGVYQVEKTARVVDAIKAAGGLTKKAASYGINQAEPLKDGMQIYVPTKKEIKLAKVSKPVVVTSEATVGNSKEVQSNTININTASKEELMKLNGVGEAKAALIINYRESNGGFKNITDLMKIKGIKKKFFDKIKDNICV